MQTTLKHPKLNTLWSICVCGTTTIELNEGQDTTVEHATKDKAESFADDCVKEKLAAGFVTTGNKRERKAAEASNIVNTHKRVKTSDPEEVYDMQQGEREITKEELKVGVHSWDLSTLDKTVLCERLQKIFKSVDFLQPVQASDKAIEAAERALQVRLPELYKAVLRVQNGGYLRKPLWPADGIAMGNLDGVSTDQNLFNTITRSYADGIDEWGRNKWLVPLSGDGDAWVCFDYRDPNTRRTGVNVPIVTCQRRHKFEPRLYVSCFTALLMKIEEASLESESE